MRPGLVSLGAGILALSYALGINYTGSSVHLFGCMLVGLIGAGLMLLPGFRANAGDSIEVSASFETGSGIRWSPAHWLLLAYLGWQTLLLFTSSLPETSFTFYWLWCSFVLLAIGASQLEKPSWLKLLALFSLAGVFSAGWGLLEFFENQQRANGPIVDPNAWAAMQNLFFFGLVSVYLVETRLRWVLLPVLAMFCLAMFSAYSRTGLVVFVLASAYLVAVCACVKSLRKPVLALVGTCLLCFALIHGSVSQVEATRHSEGYTVDVSEHGWTQRFAMWRGALGIAEAYPVLGSGPGTFVVQYPLHREPGDVRTLGYFAHNDYLQFLAEGGPLLLGFLMLLLAWLGFLLLRLSIQVIKGRAEPVESLVLTVAIGTVLAHSLMNFALYQIQVQMLLGLLLARLIVLEVPLTQLVVKAAFARFVKIAGVLFITLVMAVAILDALSFELIYERKPVPTIMNVRQDPGRYFDLVSLLASIRSGNSANRLALATLYRTGFDRQGNDDARQSLALISALEYKAALEINPYHVGIRQFFAGFLEQNPQLQQLVEINVTAEALLREGVRLAPSHVENHLNLIAFLERHARSDEAYEVLRNDAFKWVHLRRGDFEANRLLIYRMLLSRAIARGDKQALEEIIASINILRLTPEAGALQ